MSRLNFCSLCLVVGLVGCGDNFKKGDLPPDAAPETDGGVTSPFAGLAVVNSDYVSTSVSLLDRSTGQVAKGDCINSGTQTPGNTLALSGDVGLPSQPQPMNLLVTIDRANSALTWIDPKTCTPLRQLDVSTKFYANPHDVIAVSPTKAYVTRYEKNTTPTADTTDRDEGDDLLIIDPSVPSITGRIGLSSYAGTGVQARPDRARLIDGKLFVLLSNLSGDFSTAAEGRLVIVDTATDQVSGTVDLPGLKNCGGLSYVESTKTLLVACGGSFADADQAASSGVAYVATGASPPAMMRKQDVAPFDGRALAGFSGIARDGAVGFGVTFGNFGGNPTDQFWALNAQAGTATKLSDAADSFTYGTVLVDPSHERVYLTDANAVTPRVHLYRYVGGVALEASVNANPAIGLPPRELAWY